MIQNFPSLFFYLNGVANVLPIEYRRLFLDALNLILLNVSLLGLGSWRRTYLLLIVVALVIFLEHLAGEDENLTLRALR